MENLVVRAVARFILVACPAILQAQNSAFTFQGSLGDNETRANK